MRKFFMALAVVIVTLAVAAPDIVSAADFKYSGLFRYRGGTSDDTDRDDTSHDSIQKHDSLWRPKFTATSLKGKIKAVAELNAGSNTSFDTTSRPNVDFNKLSVDFAVPGTTLRYRFARSDWKDPTGEIIGGAGLYRQWGHGVYGKLTKTVSLNAWNSTLSDGGAAYTDNNDYYVSLKWKAAPNITLTPWIAWQNESGTGNERLNDLDPENADGTNAGDTILAGTTNLPDADSADRDIWFYGLHVNAKFGIASINAMAVINSGELDFSRGVNADGRSDLDIEGYAVLIRSWLNFGKLKVGFYGSWMPGDSDVTSTTGDFGTQGDNKLTRFTTLKGGNVDGSCRINGPQLYTNRRYTSMDPSFAARNRCGNGDGGVKGNGSHIYELMLKYKLTKALGVEGNVSFIRSASARADIDTDADGTADTMFVSDKGIGTEVDVSAKYDIYKGLWARLTYAHLFAGDYGKSSDAGTRAFDDSWALFWELRHTF